MKRGKKWKKMIDNCPFLIALLVTWGVITIGGLVLIWYRDYNRIAWQNLVDSPLFALAMQEEIQGKMTEPVMAQTKSDTSSFISGNAAVSNLATDSVIGPDRELLKESEQDKIASVIKEKEEKLVKNIEENLNKLNPDLINRENKNYPAKEETLPVLAWNPAKNHETTENWQGNPVLIDAAKKLEQERLQAEENAKKALEAATQEEGEKEAGEPTAEETIGQTRFITYTPMETDSIYYSDAGKIALTTDYPYQKVDESYFENAAFIGDSRTYGIADYSGLEADFYCENGMTIYKVFGEKGITYQKTGQQVNLSDVLQQKQYDKIYIMLGMNELGYGDTPKYKEQYRAVVEQIREWQPQALIFLSANLHVSKEKNNLESEFNNININDKNVAAASLADGETIFYLDSNPLFVDEDGFLKEDLTFDGVHLYANNYKEWKNFFMEHGVVKNTAVAEQD